jgi:hypothetical protein
VAQVTACDLVLRRFVQQVHAAFSCGLCSAPWAVDADVCGVCGADVSVRHLQPVACAPRRCTATGGRGGDHGPGAVLRVREERLPH